MKRTHTCGELNIKDINKKVILQGWVKKIRKMGNLSFIDLRDSYGITQLVLNNDLSDLANTIKTEYVIEITGIVSERKSKNLQISTGEIEIIVEKLKIINKSESTPFVIDDNVSVNEDTRLKYRYLDLRRDSIKNKLQMRSKMYHIMRTFLYNESFTEIETPILAKSTPEGARDFLVPSRLNENKYYALPQSPQLFKQLLMISGFDKYYQIVKCFRDEDLRNDRQLEFTQLDIEMSFATDEDIKKTINKLIIKIFKKLKNINITEPILEMKYKDAIEFYGSDKPDLRYDLKINDLTEIFKNTNIENYKNIENKFIKGIFIDKLIAKKQLEQLNEVARQNGLDYISVIKYDNGTWTGNFSNTLSDIEKENLIKKFNIKNTGTILLNISNYKIISKVMGAIRCAVADMFELINKDTYKILWVVDFPLFEYSEEENRYLAAHHPFTMPKEEYLNSFDKDKENALANAYDLVINGYEIGGGSQRITDNKIQEKMFNAIELDKEDIENNFGWFLKAYQFGAPYHSGIALGIDRLIMILTNSESIRDTIAFPKNSRGVDLMIDAPSLVTERQLQEINNKK